MYCGCNPTALSSQTQISEALTRLLAEKSYTKITVSELCRASGVSRQTFYSLFSSMENVVVFTLQEKACRLPRETETLSSLEQLCKSYSAYICENRDYLKMLVDNKVAYLLYDSIRASLLCCRAQSADASRREAQYTSHFLAGALTGVVQQYCAEDPPPSADVLDRMLHDLFSGVLFRQA